MKIRRLATGMALLGALSGGTAWAQGLSQPAPVSQVALGYDSYGAEEDGTGESSAATGCHEPSCCEPPCYSCSQGCRLGDPWTLPVPCWLERRGIAVGGWISAGLYGNSWGAPSNGPLGYNDISGGFNLHQLWAYAEKAADTGGYGVDFGARIDYVFGIDGQDEQSFGDGSWDFGWNSSRDYGSAIPQLYLEVAYDDLSVKLGHFYTIVGWEVSQAPENFFYSHAYTMYYGEPVKHTGFLAEYTASDRVTAWGGWTAGWDTGWDNLVDASTFLGGLSFSLSDNASLTWALSFGDYGTGLGDVYFNSIVLELGLTDKLTYILQHDLGDNSSRGPESNEWYGVNQYLIYRVNDCWSGGLRFEWFRDDDGARVIDGNAGNYYEATAGINYRPHPNVVFRPELRIDWFDGITPAGRPFDRSSANEQLSGGFDFIVTY
jgi:hypothetical protein